LKTVRLRSSTARWLHRQWQKRGLWARLLWPLSCLAQGYVFAKRRWYERDTKRAYRAPVPVVVVGNLYVGGVGKTPVVIALVQQLKALGFHPGVVSRGYGVKLGPTARLGQGELEADLVGDEPALISQQTHAPICVHPNRRLACQTLLNSYPEVDIIVSDDGLQHLALKRDLEIIVQDQRGVGNGWLLPAGPLREPPDRLGRVDLVITRETLTPTRSAEQGSTHRLKSPAQPSVAAPTPRSPVELLMWLQITAIHSLDRQINLSVKEFIAFQKTKTTVAIAAISEPDRFFKSLTEASILYQNTLGLPDHDRFDADVFNAWQADLFLITAKDAVKCRSLRDPRIWVVVAEAAFSDPLWATKLLKQLPLNARSQTE